MSADIDPYYQWLGIPPDERPIDYYRLLGIRRFEANLDVIGNAADQRMAHVRSVQSGRHGKLIQQILKELSDARLCLFDPVKKAAYDRKLRAQADSNPAVASKSGLRVAKPLVARPLEESAAPASQPTPAAAREEAPAPAAATVEEQPSTDRPTSTTTAESDQRSAVPRWRGWALPVAIGSVLVLGVVVGVLIYKFSNPAAPTIAQEDPDNQQKEENTAATDADQNKSDNTSADNGSNNGSDSTDGSGGNAGTPAGQVGVEPAQADPPINTPQPALYTLRFAKGDSVELLNSKGVVDFARPFTIELWVRMAADGGDHWLAGDYAAAGSHPSVAEDESAGWQLFWSDGMLVVGAGKSAGATVKLDDEWHHVAICGDTLQLHVFVDGQPVQARLLETYEWKASELNVHLGSHGWLPDGQKRELSGDLRAFRLSSACRYTTSFEPAASFERDEATTVLLDFNRPQRGAISDISGNGVQGKVAGADWVAVDTDELVFAEPKPPVAAGPSGRYALRFTQHTDRVELASSRGLIDAQRPFTIEAWLRLAAGEADAWLVGDIAAGGLHTDVPDDAVYGWQLMQQSDLLGFGGNQIAGLKPATTAAEKWHHVAVCGDGSHVRFYLDGKVRSEPSPVDSLDWEPSPSNIFVGSTPFQSAGDRWSFKGDVAGVRLSRTCRYTDVFEPPGEFANDENTLALLDLSEPGGKTIADLSGNGHEGAISGALWIDITRPDGLPIASTDPGPNGTDTGQPPQPPAKPPIERQPIPSDDALAAARKEVQSVFEAEFAAAQKPADKIKLADTLLKLTRDEKEKAANRYVLFEESIRLIGDIAEPELVLSIVEDIDQWFLIDVIAKKLDVLKNANESVRTSEGRKQVIEAALELTSASMKEWKLDLAKDAIQLAVAASTKSNEAALRRAVRERRDEVDRLQQQADFADSAAERLKAEPDNVKANLAYGGFWCFVREDWATGVPYLAKGDDPLLKAAAELELAEPQKVDKQLELAEAWTKAAENVQPAELPALQRRAYHWYRIVSEAASGLTKLQASKRMEEIETKFPGVVTTAGSGDGQPLDFAGDGLVGRIASGGRDLGVYVTYVSGQTESISSIVSDRGTRPSSKSLITVDLVGKIELSGNTTVAIRSSCATTSNSSRALSTFYINGKPASAATTNQATGTEQVQIRLKRGTHDLRWQLSGAFLGSCELSLKDDAGNPLRVYHTKDLEKAASALPTAGRIQLQK